jgi:hypothetical protein
MRVDIVALIRRVCFYVSLQKIECSVFSAMNQHEILCEIMKE